ncbi:MAG: YciI family protein [Guyparkeria sp.]|uniref:YciI family protein n=1 Tax=Guyparkeria sp. TaxID=2035736 RepID=UPI00397B97C3
MQWFMIVANDVADSAPLRARHRDAHRARIESMTREGRILTAGPLPIDPGDPERGLSGSLVIAAFEDIEAARTWAEADPFRTGGVYDSVDVRPYKPIFGATG